MPSKAEIVGALIGSGLAVLSIIALEEVSKGNTITTSPQVTTEAEKLSRMKDTKVQSPHISPDGRLTTAR
ncbi:MAG: hypothetical protein ABH816_02025 [Candidatus Levyibacteriota bacterium]